MFIPVGIDRVSMRPGPVSTTLIAGLVTVHGANALFPELGLAAMLAGGPSRLDHAIVTRALIHADLAHLIVNIVYLYFFGSLVCRTLGNRVFLVVGLSAVVIAGFVSVAIRETTVGSSAFVSGVMGVALATYPLRRFWIAYFFGFSNGTFGMPLLWITAAAVLADLTGLVYYITKSTYYAGIAHWSHIAGLCVGFVIGYAGIRDRILVRRDAQDEPTMASLLSDPRRFMPRLHRSDDNSRIVDTWVLVILLSLVLGSLAMYMHFWSLPLEVRHFRYFVLPLFFLVISALLATSIYWTEKTGGYFIALVVIASAIVGSVLHWAISHYLAPLVTLLWLMQASTDKVFWPRAPMQKYAGMFSSRRSD